MTSQAEKVGAAQSVTTRFTFVGLADQVALEERKDTSGAFKVTKSYAYGAAGENLSLTDIPVNTTTSKKSFYGTNPHSDVETLTDATGRTTSTYRYTAYGRPDKIGTTGEDAITGIPSLDADVVNPYRFNSKRFNGATGTYDMGFREYNPGLNRFVSRDMYAGALQDMALGSDPWNTNRYMFGGGNPISRIELDGHLNREESIGGGIIGSNLEVCGSDCYLDFSSGGDPVVDPSPGDSFNDAIDNGLVGAVQGIIETGEQVVPTTSLRKATGTADSQLFHNLVQMTGAADTDSTAYQAGLVFGPHAHPHRIHRRRRTNHRQNSHHPQREGRREGSRRGRIRGHQGNQRSWPGELEGVIPQGDVAGCLGQRGGRPQRWSFVSDVWARGLGSAAHGSAARLGWLSLSVLDQPRVPLIDHPWRGAGQLQPRGVLRVSDLQPLGRKQ